VSFGLNRVSISLQCHHLDLRDVRLNDDVQRHVQELWPQISTENLHELTDFEGYKSDFLRLFGFGMPNVNYDADVNPEVPIPHLA
jgi:enoyl-[acyl-carrier protein] reductase/trans-2-enoyl-CoA reductase (NAD+)